MEIKHKTPFYSQKWNLNDWQRLGFKSYKDAEYWEKSSCAILCLKMVLDSVYPQNASSIHSLIKQGVEMGAYTDKTGWSHSGIVKLAEHYKFKAVASEKLKPENIKKALQEGSCVIVSIKWAFENYKTLKEKILFWKKYGGHLALVVGYKEENNKLEGFYVHHTSIKPEYNWENRFIPLDKFIGGFTGRGIVVNGKEK
mgnify:CR=1 FL=1